MAHAASLLAQFEITQWMYNPAMFWAGLAAVSVPIVIHLLNKRKFRVVDWAAMDFLLDADKQNRRRIRLENLLLLLLRCAAVLLIGLLLARPIMPTSLTAGLIDAEQFERIVVLDDSLSMQARQGNESVWEASRRRAVDLVRALADEPSDNALTLIVTSQPDRPVLNGVQLSASTVDDLVARLERLEPQDTAADLPAVLKELEDTLGSQPAHGNRLLYVFSDLRQRDWRPGENAPAAPLPALARLSQHLSGCYVVNVAESEDRNLTIAEVRPEGAIVAGVLSRFDVVVANQGSSEARDIRIKFTAGDALPLHTEIERIPAGGTALAPFSFTFTDEIAPGEGEAGGLLAPKQVRIELQTARHGEDDRLPADSVAFYPARLVKGIPTLIVDGDPSADFGRSEAFYLRRSLAPRGPVASGVSADVVTENELESLSLEKYQTIFLTNVYRLGDRTAENLEKLERWVEAGGGLVIMPGDQIDEHFFNEHYYRNGEGLSPLKLENIEGDETESKWVNLRIEQANHQVLKVFEGQNNPFLDNVKTFRWWGSTAAKEQLGRSVSIIARFNDPSDSPALAEKAHGKGRVVLTSFPGDADWSNWTSDPSYLIAMQELVRYLASDRGDRGSLRVGQPLTQALDLTQYEIDASLEGPDKLAASLQAAASDQDERDADTVEAVWQITYPRTPKQGFYTLLLNRRDGGQERTLFAANVDPSEGDLRHVDLDAMKRQLGDAKVQVLDVSEAASLAGDSTQTELWWYLLWGLVGVLCCEQGLGWVFGRGR